MKPYKNCKKCQSINLLDRYNFGSNYDEYGGYLCTDCGFEFCRKNKNDKENIKKN